MIFESEVNFGDVVKMTKNGVVVASFPKILTMLKKRYKEIYGSDINLENTTADGIWLHDISLLINNILETMQMLYANLDVNSATGVYLENLCSLANVNRKQATPSIAEVTITNIGNAPIQEMGITCIDKEGREWSTTQSIELDSNESVVVELVCSEVGEIKAVAGSIYQVINTSSNVLLSVSQTRDAIVGTNEESDADLRARKNQANSPIGMTILESLQGALLQSTGVRDSFIINNAQATANDTYKGFDNTEIAPHTIYIVLRTLELSDEIKHNIADTIYNKLTPGIATQEPDASVLNGEKVEISYYPNYYGRYEDVEGYDTTIYWKQATPVHPTITITLTPKNHYTPSERKQVGQELIQYLNNLQLNTDLVVNDLTLKVMELDPLFKGTYTYGVSSITIADAVNGTYTNKLTYYDYNEVDTSIDNKIIIKKV